MNISPKAWNIQDTIHRPNEAQEGVPKYGYLGPLRRRSKIPMGGDTEPKLGQRPKETTSKLKHTYFRALSPLIQLAYT